MTEQLIGDLELITQRLRLRPLSRDDYDELIDLAASGIHDPAFSPFGVPWTDDEPARRRVLTIQHYEKAVAFAEAPSAAAEDGQGSLHLVVRLRSPGAAIGVQSITWTDYRALRSFATGSWLALRYQRQGFGTEMRAAVLSLMFDEALAQLANSQAYAFNQASQRTSLGLGYELAGSEIRINRGLPRRLLNFQLRRERFFDLRAERPVVGSHEHQSERRGPQGCAEQSLPVSIRGGAGLRRWLGIDGESPWDSAELDKPAPLPCTPSAQ